MEVYSLFIYILVSSNSIIDINNIIIIILIIIIFSISLSLSRDSLGVTGRVAIVQFKFIKF